MYMHIHTLYLAIWPGKSYSLSLILQFRQQFVENKWAGSTKFEMCITFAKQFHLKIYSKEMFAHF